MSTRMDTVIEHPTTPEYQPVQDMPESKLVKALKHPWMALSAVMGFGRGFYYRAKFKLLRRRVTIGKNFKVYGPLMIRGPGTVIIGDDCSVLGTRIMPVTPFTTTKEAVITIGDRVVMQGTRFGCQKRIDVGDDAGLSETHIMDSDFHSTGLHGVHRADTKGVGETVTIGPNTWLCAGSMVLKGVTVGENSVVGGGAVVAQDVPENVVVFGNPARVIWRFQVDE